MKLITYSIIIFSLLLQGCSSTSLINKGLRKYESGKYSKAEGKFTKAIEKGGGYPALDGRAFTYLKLRQNQNAINDITKAMASPDAKYTYDAAKIYAQLSQSETAFNYLCYMYSKENHAYYVKKSISDSDFRNVSGTERFQNYTNGFRRIKLEVLEAHSSWNESKLGIFSSSQDPFCIVNATLKNGKKTLILATPEISDNNDAYWQNQYVIFDHILDTTIEFVHFDADVTEFEHLSSMSGFLWPNVYISGSSRDNAKFRISDTNSPVFTSGTDVPSTIGLRDLLNAYRVYTVLKFLDNLSSK